MNQDPNEPVTPQKPRFDKPPKGFTLETVMGGVALVKRWRNFTVIPLGVFCLFWNGFVLAFVGSAIAEKNWMILVFISGHLLIGLGLAYYVLAMILNRTRICVTYREVKVEHGPMPWFGRKNLPVHSIDQVFTREVVSRTKNGHRRTYRVMVLDRQGAESVLIRTLDHDGDAFYIEQEIESILGIRDRPVEGEHQPSPLSGVSPLELFRQALREAKSSRRPPQSS